MALTGTGRGDRFVTKRKKAEAAGTAGPMSAGPKGQAGDGPTF